MIGVPRPMHRPWRWPGQLSRLQHTLGCGSHSRCAQERIHAVAGCRQWVTGNAASHAPYGTKDSLDSAIDT